ncbi:MAG: tetratricopeptide repeat protein [Polyangiaceae bacterium]
MDDRDLVVDDGPFLSGPDSLIRAFTRSYMHAVDRQHPYYRPLVTVSYALDARWSGVRPFGYHLTNVVLDVLASLLCCVLLRAVGFDRVLASLGALLFAVHPALGAAVAWVPGRNDLLLAVFALAAWICFLQDAQRPSWRWRLAHLGFLALALLTKETAAVLPFIFGAHVLALRPERGRIDWTCGSIVGLALGWASCLAVRLAIQAKLGLRNVDGLDITQMGSRLAATLTQVLFPVNPSLVSVVSDVPTAPGLVVTTMLGLTAAFAPGVVHRRVVLGAVVFLVTAGPFLLLPGTVLLGQRLVLPVIGAVIVIAEIARSVGRDRRALVAFSGVTLAFLGLMTLGSESAFRSRRAFSRAAVDAAPHSPLAHFCLGESDQRDGAFDQALAEYNIALSLGPLEVVHNNIAVIYMASSRWHDAERELRDDLVIDPRHSRALRNLGVVLRHEGRLDEAAAAEQRALDLEGTVDDSR